MQQYLFHLPQKLLFSISIFLIITLSVIGGYKLGKTKSQSTSLISPTIPLKQVEPLPVISYMIGSDSSSLMPSPSINMKKDFIIPTNGTIFEACSYPWDYNVANPSPADIECLEFAVNGIVRKKIQSGISSSSMTLSSNNYATIEERENISSELQKIYQTLTSEKLLNWLQKPKAPIVGAVMPHIKLYSGDLNRQYTITIYMWGADHSEESQQVKEIFEQLQSFSPPSESTN